MKDDKFDVIAKKNIKEDNVFDLSSKTSKPPITQSFYNSNQDLLKAMKKFEESIFTQERSAQCALCGAEEYQETRRKQEELKQEGIKAIIESRDQLIEQNELLRKQLTEQTEINQRLEHEFEMGAREAVITRQKANWSLAIGIAGLIVAIVAIIVGMIK